MLKKKFFSLAFLTTALLSYAYDATVDGIYYNLDSSSKTAEVTYSPDNEKAYTGVITIPKTVTYDGKTYTVTSIGSYAFEGCSGLTSVTIPNSVTEIGSDAFWDCDELTEVNVNFTDAEDFASYLNRTDIADIFYESPLNSATHFIFINGEKQTSITIPNSVTSIGSYAFGGCSGLTEVTIPNSVTEIGSSAFEGCSGLTSVTIPNSVTEIGSSAFSYCSGLTSVTIPNSVTSIGSYAFSYCSGLTSVTIPNSVTSIGKKAFEGCSGLTSVNMNFTDTEDFASYLSRTDINIYKTFAKRSIFINGEEQTSITIPNSVSSIGSYALYNCSDLTEITIGNSVTSIGEYAFFGCSSLTSMTIPNSVTSIENNSFWGCDELTSVNMNFTDTEDFASYLSRTDISAVFHTSGLGLDSVKYSIIINGEKQTSITIPNSVTSIGSYAFYNCSDLTEITIGNSVTSIGEVAFYGCTGLTKIIFNAENCTNCSFSTCTNLTSLTIGDNVKTIPSSAFYGCSALTSVTIGNSVTSIGDYAFSCCTGLTEVTIGNSVTKIGSRAFYFCTGLTEVTIPNSVTSIGYQAFTGTAWYTNQADGVTYIGNVLYTYKGTMPDNTSIEIKEGTTSITGSAFYGCSGLTSVTIPNSVTDISSYAFGDCTGLTSVTIGKSVASIGNSAFEGCTRLTEIISQNPTPPTCETGVFDTDTYWDATLKVPDVDAYQNSLYAWSNFVYIEQYTTAGIDEISVAGDAVEVARYSVDGKRLSQPTPGVNIVRYSDGTTRKVVVK